MSEKKATARYIKTLGSFNWANERAKQWQVVLYTSFGNVSVLFEHDEEPDIDDLLPTEVLDLIETAIKKFWIYTQREEKLAKIAEIRAHGDDIDIAWLRAAEARAAALEGGYHKRLVSLLDAIEERNLEAQS